MCRWIYAKSGKWSLTTELGESDMQYILSSAAHLKKISQIAYALASVLFSAFFAKIFGGGSASPSARTRIGRIFCARKRE